MLFSCGEMLCFLADFVSSLFTLLETREKSRWKDGNMLAVAEITTKPQDS